MLTQEDLQAIAGLISQSEERVTTRIMAYVESHVENEIHQIADGHRMLAEKMDRIEYKIDALDAKVSTLQGEVTAQEFVLTRLQKAQ